MFKIAHNGVGKAKLDKLLPGLNLKAPHADASCLPVQENTLAVWQELGFTHVGHSKQLGVGVQAPDYGHLERVVLEEDSILQVVADALWVEGREVNAKGTQK